MKVNIVIGDKDLTWILGRLAKELKLYNGWTINESGADIDYCVPYLMYKHATSNFKVPLFTHKERDMPEKVRAWDEISSSVIHSVSLSENTKNELPIDIQSFSQVIRLASDLFNPIMFGAVGKDHNSGRKNFAWIPELRKEFSVLYRSFGENQKEREEFYNKIDYLIVTSSIEGGPVPVLDAIAMGVPVIAPDVGFCWEFPCIKYEKNNFKSLRDVMIKLTKIRNWRDVADDHKKYFEGLI